MGDDHPSDGHPSEGRATGRTYQQLLKAVAADPYAAHGQLGQAGVCGDAVGEILCRRFREGQVVELDGDERVRDLERVDEAGHRRVGLRGSRSRAGG